MSSGFKGGASRVSISSGAKKTIENIKEITGKNHTEEEIYAMLQECNMDPNETTQKLLLLDTFHEVKRKRDKKKENLNKEPVESKWKPGPQARANRVGRGNYSSRYTYQDAGGGRNLSVAKENTSSHLMEKGTSKIPLATPQDMRKNETSSASPTTIVSNGPSGIVSESTHENHASAGEGVNQSNTAAVVSIKNSNAAGNKDLKQHQKLELINNESSFPSPPAQESHLSASDNVPLPSQDTIQHDLGTQRVSTEPLDDNPNEGETASAKISAGSEVVVTNLEQNVPIVFHEDGKIQHLESTQTSPSTGSRPSSNYNNRSQLTGPQKVSPAKEWKPKSTDPNIGLSVTTAGSSEVPAASVGSHSEPQATPVVIASKEATLELQRKFEETHISDSQHVIIPNHLHVPEVEKLGFCFGSFDASFELDMNQNGIPGSEKSPLLSESSETIDGPVKDPPLSNQSVLVAPEDTEPKYPDHPKSPSQGPEIFSASEVEVSSDVGPDYSESKREDSDSPVPVLPIQNYSYGFMPPILGGQLPTSESSESQARDASRLPGVVPQSFDPASYYAQFYRPSLDNDGRISPFHTSGPAGATNKYNGNAALVSTQTPQELQGGVPVVLSTTSQTPLVTQAAGVMHSSITPTQQPLPVFRQPAGVHLPHYPPNFIPYGPYFSPFYVPQPAIHQFLSNGAFPQQPQAGGMYPTAPGTNAKYSVSQYKQGPNTGSSAHIAVPGNYAQYGLSMPNYTSGSAMPAVTSTPNEDTPAPQTKENNVYSSGQQNEASGVWFTTPGRDISTLQASSFYNLPQGQLAFATPSQPGHGPYAGIFHPAQAMTAANVHHPLLQQSQAIPNNPSDMVGPTTGVYHQQQHTQLNWPSNY